MVECYRLNVLELHRVQLDGGGPRGSFKVMARHDIPHRSFAVFIGRLVA
jgi:hypothetical protein